jgi:copper chaperone CopZ
VSAVDRALRSVHGVSAVEVSLETGVVDVSHIESVSMDTLVSAVDGAGFDVISASK